MSGTPGNFTLNFTVTNNAVASQDIYFFGTLLSARDIVASPATWDPNTWVSWDNTSFGGANSNYNNNWIDGTPIAFGSSLSGFQVHVTDLVAPASVNWFAFASGSVNYPGPGCIHCGSNPGFEGTAHVAGPARTLAAVPTLGE